MSNDTSNCMQFSNLNKNKGHAMSAFVSVAFCYQGNGLTCETISTQTEVP